MICCPFKLYIETLRLSIFSIETSIFNSGLNGFGYVWSNENTVLISLLDKEHSPDPIVILSKPFVNTVISGAATENQLVSNLNAQDINLTESQIHKLNNLRMTSVKYWEDRSKLAWN